MTGIYGKEARKREMQKRKKRYEDQGIPYTKQFDGKQYHADGYEFDKKTAKARAIKEMKQFETPTKKYLSRVVPKTIVEEGRKRKVFVVYRYKKNPKKKR